jgi:Outer membrane protein beta-barrel domain
MRKNLFVATIFILVVNLVSAQSTRLGFYAGPVASNMYEKVGDESRMHNYLLGASIGILLDVPMQRIGSFQPGLNYIGKNSKDEYTDNTGTLVKTKTTLSYLEIPLNVLFRLPGGGGKVTLGGGVSVAMALDGHRSTIAGSAVKVDKKLGFGDEPADDYGKYDFGLNALAGYEFKNGFFVTFNYNYGIHRLFVGGDPEDKLFNNYIALRAGFLLGGGKKK